MIAFYKIETSDLFKDGTGKTKTIKSVISIFYVRNWLSVKKFCRMLKMLLGDNRNRSKHKLEIEIKFT